MTTGERVTRGKFKIGDWVRVAVIVMFVRVHKRRRIRCRPLRGAVGQITGVVTRMEGNIKTDFDDCAGPYDPAVPKGNYLAVTAQHELWEVRLGMKNRPVLAFEADLTPYDEGELPWLRIVGSAWTDADRARMSEDSKHWPRDEKGRWMSA